MFKQSGYSAKYRSARNRVTNLLHRAKADYFKHLNPRDPKKFWKAVKHLNKQQATIPTLQKGELTAKSDLDKAEMLNTFFSSCFNNSHPPLTALPSDFSHPPIHHDSLDEMYCTVGEVTQLLQNLEVSKASGSDRISTHMLKNTAASIAPSINSLFNLSIRLGKVPDQWKHSTIVPIPKSSKPAEPGNYRLISLICILCKLLEKHMCNLMHNHLSNSNLLSNTQWGFRSGRSTVTALLSIIHKWLSALEHGKEVCVVFFDYRKAFDSVPHKPLLEKLENLNFDEVILRWVTDYLTNRFQNVVVNGESSQSAQVISGVPQGSVLGPLLFLIYINDLSEVPLGNGASTSLYADDVLLYRVINISEDFVALQDDIDKINSWSNTNFLALNRAKCKYMIISRRRAPSVPQTPLLLGDCSLEQVDSFKYLGVLLSHNLSWDGQVQSVCSKARKILGLLYRRFYNNAPGDSLLQLYLSLVRPHLDYASTVWSPHLMKHKIALENVQKFACRMATKIWDSSYQDLLELVNLPTLEHRRLETRLCLLYRITHKLCYFDDNIFTHSTSLSHHARHNLTLSQPFAHTNSYLYSFVPHTISYWNKLNPTLVTCPSLSAFKHHLPQYCNLPA